jgi:hypothetical protein
MHTQKERKKQGEIKFELPLLFHLQINEVHDGMVRMLAKENLCPYLEHKKTKRSNTKTKDMKSNFGNH